MTTNQQAREVVQSDREAAASATSATAMGRATRAAILNGEYDHLPLVQVFAAHRLAALSTTSEGGAVEALREALKPFAKLANAVDAAALDYLGVGLSGITQETTLPVGGEAIRDKCPISIAALVAARAALASARGAEA